MTVREIINQWLKDNGYDGLYTADCGCKVDDLAPCGSEDTFGCEPGHIVPCDPETCPADGDCPWHIGPKKEK